MWTEKLIGPPGTGKTSELIRRVEKELSDGVDPARLGYYSFTRAAARVAQKRAQAAFPDYPKSSFQHFRTLHSEAFRLLGWTRDKVMVGKNLREFSAAYGYEISEANLESEDVEEHEVREAVLQTLGDYLLFFVGWRRNLMLDFDSAYGLFWEISVGLPDGWSPGVVRQFEERYQEYKVDKGFLDFNDMLYKVLEERLFPDLDVLIFDEAQDSSPLQYCVLDYWLQRVKRHYIGGDPDQCIYGWMGVDPEMFPRRHCDVVTRLTQSYRVPETVLHLATQIVCSTGYLPRPEAGWVKRGIHLADVLRAFDEAPGTCFLLVRNRYLLSDLLEALLQWGIPFENLRGPAPFRGKTAEKILTIRRLFRGEIVSAEQLRLALDKVPQRHNFQRGLKAEIKRWAKEQPERPVSLSEIRSQCLSSFLEHPIRALGLPPQTNAYFKRVIDRYGEGILLEKPRLTVGTIHSVKGMEADWVGVFPDMSRKTWESSQKLSAEEKRVWYVAATRAREGLWLFPPSSEYYWQWPKNGYRIDLEF